MQDRVGLSDVLQKLWFQPPPGCADPTLEVDVEVGVLGLVVAKVGEHVWHERSSGVEGLKVIAKVAEIFQFHMKFLNVILQTAAMLQLQITNPTFVFIPAG